MKVLLAALLSAFLIPGLAADKTFKGSWGHVAIDADSLQVTWTKNAQPAGSAVLSADATEHVQLISNVNDGDSIRYVVRKINAGGQTDAVSQILSATVTAPPTAAINLTIEQLD